MTKEALKEAIIQRLRINCGCSPRQAGDADMLRACAMVLRDSMAERGATTREERDRCQERQVHYLSLEFLMGRSLLKNAYNLGLLESLTQAVNLYRTDIHRFRQVQKRGMTDDFSWDASAGAYESLYQHITGQTRSTK